MTMNKVRALVTRTITCLMLLPIYLSQRANAEIYKVVEPTTGAIYYTNKWEPGATPTNMGDTLSEIPQSPQSKARTDAQRKHAAESSRKRQVVQQQARDELKRLYPSACERTCNIEPGMPIDLVILAMDMVVPDGYSHTTAGKVERFRHGACRLTASGGKVTGVFC